MKAINYDNLPDAALLREKQLAPILPWSSATLWRRVKTGQFPQPVRLDGRVTCWRWGDVRDWLEAQTDRRAAA